jgi:hypothetical protein
MSLSFAHSSNLHSQSSSLSYTASFLPQTKYSIPFNKEEISKLEKYVTESTAFSIQKLNGRRISVDNFKDWCTIESKFLLRFGHAPSDYEKTIFAEEAQGKYQHYTPPVTPGKQYGLDRESIFAAQAFF